MSRHLIIAGIFISTGFLLNLLWELAQAPLYGCYATLNFHCVAACLQGALGDVLMLAALYAFIAFVLSDIYWDEHVTREKLVLLVVSGATLAIIFEQFAMLTNRWQYTDAMPLIPILHVGLFPLLQMMLLPLVTSIITNKLKRYV